ncbi:hypothetical protein OIU84_001187 [Salix udensis]|uniref:Uncharacterized protein n=1 Tax=Salix udensis TaxID=889485 RepID=A0AAD6K6A9_9ROSI|nr:hypothetical protein OIU84_001187 [Salix udensis]
MSSWFFSFTFTSSSTMSSTSFVLHSHSTTSIMVGRFSTLLSEHRIAIMTTSLSCARSYLPFSLGVNDMVKGTLLNKRGGPLNNATPEPSRELLLRDSLGGSYHYVHPPVPI